MGRHGTSTGSSRRAPSLPLLTSRRHIDLQRVCSAISLPG
ncbi:putative leader peptide [Streptomyces shenzhenensis]